MDICSHIDLKYLDQVALLNRLDSKYLLHSSQMTQIPDSVWEKFGRLHIGGTCSHAYDSLYLEPSNMVHYHEHQQGRVNRLKVRLRTYVDSNLHYLEVKRKDGTGKTRKKRMRIRVDAPDVMELWSILQSDSALWESCCTFFEDRFVGKIGRTVNPLCDYEPSLRILFERQTFASINPPQRITIDSNVRFAAPEDGQLFDFGPINIIEVKQERGAEKSAMIKYLKSAGIRTSGWSKYCMGHNFRAKALEIPIKHNRFKAAILKHQKLLTQG